MRRNLRFPRLALRESPFLVALSALFLAGGCYNADLGTLDGHPLGEATSVVYALSSEGDLMVIFSDQDDLCTRLSSSEPPAGPFWAVSIWDGSPTGPDGAFASLRADNEILEYDVTPERLEVTRMQIDEDWESYSEASMPTTGIRGKVELTYESGETVSTRFEAQYCDAGLFNGME